MTRLLTPLLAVLVLVVGGFAPAASAGPAVSSTRAAADPCPAIPVSEPGRAPTYSEPRSGGWTVGCWTLTADRDGAHALALAHAEATTRARAVVRDPDGDVVTDTLLGWKEPVPTAVLTAGTTYRVEIEPAARYANLPEYRVAAFDLTTGCTPLPAPRWGADPQVLDLRGGALGCDELVTATDSPLRLDLRTSRTQAFAVLDSSGDQVCTEDQVRLGGVVRCEALPAGRYRILSDALGGRGTDATLSAIPVDTTAGCMPMPLARYGRALPVDAERRADGLAEECYSLTPDTSGPHDLRVWQAADRLDWQLGTEVWDATEGRLVSQSAGAAHVNPGPQPAQVDLVEGHDYHVLVGGVPFFDQGNGQEVRHDSRYELGVVEASSTDGCVPLDTAWDAPATRGDLDGGVIGCHVLDADPATWARLDYRAVGEAGPTGLWQRVLDADGHLVRNPQARRVCHNSAWSSDTSGDWSCQLAGPGPYRVLTNSGWGADRTSYTLAANLPTDGTGCLPLPMATWGEQLPGVGTRAAHGAGSDCWTAELTSTGRHLMSLAEPSGAWRRGALQLYDATDGRPAGGAGAPLRHADNTVDLPSGTYRVVVTGNPGDVPGSYRVGLHDIHGGASDGGDVDRTCPVLPSTSLAAAPVDGRTADGTRDCYRVPDIDGPVLMRLDSTAGASDASAVAHDPRPWTVCGARPGSERRCELEGTGPYRVVVADTAGPAGSTYRLSVREPGRREGCRTAAGTAPGAAPLTFDLPARGDTACVALPDSADLLFWALDATEDVEATLLDGDAEVVCRSASWAPDSQTCGLRDRPAPYTLRLTSNADGPRTVRVLMRRDPSAEPGCIRARQTAEGPETLEGMTTGPLDLRCHTVHMRRGEGYALNRYHGAGAVPPDVHSFAPDNGFGCAGTGPDTYRDHPICGVPHTGHQTFLVVGDTESAGPYRVDLACSRDWCTRAPRVELKRGAMRGPILVGRRLQAAGVTGVPPGGKVAWRWVVGGEVVRRTRAFTPRRVDRGRGLQLVAVVTGPDHPRTVRKTAVRKVLAARPRR